MKCKEIEPRLALYIYEELTAEERAACEAHLAACDACRKQLDELRRLHELLKACPSLEPAPDLLVECRQGLEEALEREQVGWRALLRGWLPGVTVAPATRAVAVLTLVLFGFGLGWTLRPRANGLERPVTTAAPTSFAGADLSGLRINNIAQVTPDPATGAVRITLDAARRVTLEGSFDDPRIRQLLVYAMKSYDNPGIRRDTLDALRMTPNEPAVREALMFALRHDPNPGVRLEALKTVAEMECLLDTHRSLLNVVQSDANVGVRAAAIDALIQHVEEEGTDDEVAAAFEQMAASERDPNVRAKCQYAVQRVTGNGF